jgi:hypothetical protein
VVIKIIAVMKKAVVNSVDIIISRTVVKIKIATPS